MARAVASARFPRAQLRAAPSPPADTAVPTSDTAFVFLLGGVICQSVQNEFISFEETFLVSFTVVVKILAFLLFGAKTKEDLYDKIGK